MCCPIAVGVGQEKQFSCRIRTTMVSEVVKAFLDVLKLAPRFLAATGFVAGLLLFSNDQILKRLGVTDFVQKWRFVLGLTLVVSVALPGVHFGAYLLESVKRSWRKKQLGKHVKERLHRLTEDEKQILRYYIVHKTRSNMLRIESGVVQELVSQGIIYRSANMGNLLEGFAHNIGDLAGACGGRGV